ncbi:MAG: hypothetical protein M5U34_07230 [Chloroflexi bacterium]|nr:hypothetical protein [Chloroflexota bacterium]
MFLYDVAADTLECLSVDGAGNPAGGESSSARISGDGRYVTFQSSATDLAAPNGDGSENVYLLDRATNELVSIAGDGFPAGATAAVRPDISRDGRYVVYHGSSSANSQTAAGVIAEVYVYDRLSGETRCATLQPDGFRSGRDECQCLDQRRWQIDRVLVGRHESDVGTGAGFDGPVRHGESLCGAGRV